MKGGREREEHLENLLMRLRDSLGLHWRRLPGTDQADIDAWLEMLVAQRGEVGRDSLAIRHLKRLFDCSEDMPPEVFVLYIFTNMLHRANVERNAMAPKRQEEDMN